MAKVMAEVWLQGFLAGLEHYAWQKDGVTYVGTCGTTLIEAIEKAKKDYSAESDETDVLPDPEAEHDTEWPEFHVSDTVRLEGKSVIGNSLIRQYGQWWRLAAMASKYGGKKCITMTSLMPAKQGKYRGSKVAKKCPYVVALMRDQANEKDFNVLEVNKYPSDFQWILHWDIEQAAEKAREKELKKAEKEK